MLRVLLLVFRALFLPTVPSVGLWFFRPMLGGVSWWTFMLLVGRWMMSPAREVDAVALARSAFFLWRAAAAASMACTDGLLFGSIGGYSSRCGEALLPGNRTGLSG